jgi:hypothetical protein
VLIGYVSDERHVAISDVIFEFESDDSTVVEIRSSITDAVCAELHPSVGPSPSARRSIAPNV